MVKIFIMNRFEMVCRNAQSTGGGRYQRSSIPGPFIQCLVIYLPDVFCKEESDPSQLGTFIQQSIKLAVQLGGLHCMYVDNKN